MNIYIRSIFLIMLFSNVAFLYASENELIPLSENDSQQVSDSQISENDSQQVSDSQTENTNINWVLSCIPLPKSSEVIEQYIQEILQKYPTSSRVITCPFICPIMSIGACVAGCQIASDCLSHDDFTPPTQAEFIDKTGEASRSLIPNNPDRTGEASRSLINPLN